jgi:hypothetical protein
MVLISCSNCARKDAQSGAVTHRSVARQDKEQAMQLGQQLDTYALGKHGNHWDTTLAAARACEQAGLDSVWFADHFMFPDKEHPDTEVPVFECCDANSVKCSRTVS